MDSKALAQNAKAASRPLSSASGAQKNSVLRAIEKALADAAVRREILAANERDLEAAQARELAAPLVDRLRLSEARLDSIIDQVRSVRLLADPVGVIGRMEEQASGIKVGRMSVPLGVVLMVYESRPNVTVDAAVLCIKSGNAVILRGGREAVQSNRALHEVVQRALVGEGLPKACVSLVHTAEREFLYALLKESDFIDLAIPRGGTSLIDAVNEHARVPVVQHYQGICHLYVHKGADLDMAERLLVNAKVQRPGVCNALETVVVDEAVAARFIPRALAALKAHQVEVRGCEKTRSFAECKAATDADFDTEFLSLVCACKVVANEDAALEFIAAHSSQHTASVCTNDHAFAMRFLREVDCSCVMVNASTRFNDGGELGLGAELGISTTKLHAYGPMGLEELCTQKFVVLGHGEVRGEIS